MRFILISTVLLAQAFTILAEASCEDRAKQAGLPTEGWKIVYDDAGQLKCRRQQEGIQLEELCYGVEYIDADTKVKGCCQDGGLTLFDTPDGEFARCCPRDHVWTFDKGEGFYGGCCFMGSMMHEGRCIPSPGPKHLHSEL